MKLKVYLETTIPSYLTAWPSSNVIRRAHQELTRQWWDTRRQDFELFVSQVLITECGSGDAIAAAERLKVLSGLQLLAQTTDATRLAVELINEVPLPSRASVDAVHIAIATIHRMDYLLTWNCTHIANAAFRDRIETICSRFGYRTPIICTPEELLSCGSDEDEESDNG